MIHPGDRVVITRPERRGDKQSRVTTRGRGKVLAVYPRFEEVAATQEDEVPF